MGGSSSSSSNEIMSLAAFSGGGDGGGDSGNGTDFTGFRTVTGCCRVKTRMRIVSGHKRKATINQIHTGTLADEEVTGAYSSTLKRSSPGPTRSPR